MTLALILIGLVMTFISMPLGGICFIAAAVWADFAADKAKRKHREALEALEALKAAKIQE